MKAMRRGSVSGRRPWAAFRWWTNVLVGAAALAVVPVLAFPAGAAGGDGDVRTFTVMAMDYGLTAPESVPAGRTRIEVMNHGAEPHQAALVRLEPGRTQGEYLGAVASGLEAASKIGKFVAGPNGASPGGTSEVVADLEPGRYLILCLIPSPDGTPHVVKGMIRELEVTGSASKSSVKTKRVPVVHMGEFHFELPKSFVKAVSTGAPIDVVNDGKQDHEMVVSRLPDGVDIKDVVDWSNHPLFTPEPFPQPQVDVAGATMIAPGGRARLRLDLPPGRYALLCFLPDKTSGTSHLYQGMSYPFTVR
jgi:uncharacterized cupredoxin-like copper-binding protein